MILLQNEYRHTTWVIMDLGPVVGGTHGVTLSPCLGSTQPCLAVYVCASCGQMHHLPMPCAGDFSLVARGHMLDEEEAREILPETHGPQLWPDFRDQQQGTCTSAMDAIRSMASFLDSPLKNLYFFRKHDS